MQSDMRVLYISYNGALEEIVPSQVIPYLRGLSSRGYRFTLLTFEKRQDLIRHGPDGIKGFKKRFRSEGIDWRCLRYHKRFPLLATSFDISIGALYALYLVIAGRVRVIHARSVVPAAMSLPARLLLGVKVIFDTRGLLAEEYAGGGHWKEGCLEYRGVKFFEKFCLKSASAVVVLTGRHHEYLTSMPWLKRCAPVEIIPCCVDLNRFRYDPIARARLRKKENLDGNFIFAYLGKIGKHYMFDEMLDFFTSACGTLENCRFMVISQNSSEDILNAAARRGLNRGRVIIKRPLYEEIPGLLLLADAGVFFINPYKKFASSPIKLGEFLSCGIPVIINSGIGDTEELVKTNRVGVSIDRFSDADYQAGLSEFLELAKEGDALYKRCRKTAEECLSLGRGVEKYNSIYSRIVK